MIPPFRICRAIPRRRRWHVCTLHVRTFNVPARQRATVACLGLAYKADVDDIRESPAIKVVELLRAEGFEVRAYDPYVPMGTVPGQVGSLDAAVEGADAVVVLTDHSEFRQLEPEVLSCFADGVVIDARNALSWAT